MEKPKVLFLCTGNSCRSQMAEGFLREMADDRFDVYSSGVKPSHVNPLAIRVMSEVGIDISEHTSDDVRKYLNVDLDTVITVCDRARESCPIFPGAPKQVHWGFYDPAETTGTEAERLTVFRHVRDEIQAAIREWLESSIND